MKQVKAPTDPMMQAKHKAMRELTFHLGGSQMKGVVGRHPRLMMRHQQRQQKRKRQGQEEDY
jgi:hypothetical protein